MNRHQEQAIRLVEYAGINPWTVALDDLTREGYWEFMVDETGSLVYDATGSSVRVWQEWPTGFPIDEFLEHYRHIPGVGTNQ